MCQMCVCVREREREICLFKIKDIMIAQHFKTIR